MSPEPEIATKLDFDQVVASLPAFWGERDLASLHHPMFIEEFSDSALVVRDVDRRIGGYLLGMLLPANQSDHHAPRTSHRSRFNTASISSEVAARVTRPSRAPFSFRSVSATGSPRTSASTGSLARSLLAPAAPRARVRHHARYERKALRSSPTNVSGCSMAAK